MKTLTLFVAMGLCLFSATLRAEISFPMLMDLKPVAAQVGQTSEHTVTSRYDMDGAYQVLVSGTGVTGEVVPPEPPKEGKAPPAEAAKGPKKPQTTLKVRFKVAADALPGVRDFRIGTPYGASTVGQLVVGRDPVVSETAGNDQFEKAQPITLPATVCGAIEKNEDVDFFKFEAAAGQSLSFHVRSARLEDRIHDLQTHSDPIITLKNSAGVDLAQVDNYFFADPLLAYKFTQAGTYYLEIRDVRYQGNAFWQYSIEINDRPFLTNIYPMQAVPGQESKVELVGANLPAEPRAAFTIPPGTPEEVTWFTPQGTAPLNPVPVVVSSLPAVLEAAVENGTWEAAQAVSLPAGINGRIDREADLDHFAFDAKKGDRWTFEVIARRHQSSLDSILQILDSKGKKLTENDDMRLGRSSAADSLIENWTVPADGRYILQVRDLQLRGGASFVYFLKATPAEPMFHLQTDSDKTLIPPGTAAPIFVRAFRKNGFDGEIQLAIDGLPPGVTATCGKILKGRDDGLIHLSAGADCALAISNANITGTATIPAVEAKPAADGKPAVEGKPALQLSAIAEPMQEIYMPGGGRSHFPSDQHAVSITKPLEIKKVVIEPADIVLKPGGSQKITITIERAEGFTANVTLDVIYRHLGSVFGDTLPKGVTVDTKNSKTLLNGKETVGHITLTAAKDAQLADKQLAPVMAQVAINFVMKLSYAGPPLTVTVQPADPSTAQR
jgi:hypothetical protein